MTTPVSYNPKVIEYNPIKTFMETLREQGLTPATVHTLNNYESILMKLKEEGGTSYTSYIFDSIPH